MKFAELVNLLRTLDLDEGPNSRRPPRDNVRQVQNSLSAWLRDEEFYLDCIELEHQAILQRTPSRPAPPLYRLDDRGMAVRLFYWEPGKVIKPHEHNAWTVTAVFFNALQVTTYDVDVAIREQRLEQKNVFKAVQGMAGHIFDRCIHDPSNLTKRVSTSIHIFNDCDVPSLEAEVGPIAGLGNPNEDFQEHVEGHPGFLERLKQWHLCVLARMVAQFQSERAFSVLRDLTTSGNAETQAKIERIRGIMSRGGAPEDVTTS